jgi:hypothetical protein
MYVPGQNPGDGATDHVKREGHRPDPKFDHYTSNSSEKQYINSKINLKTELKMFSHFVKFWLN